MISKSCLVKEIEAFYCGMIFCKPSMEKTYASKTGILTIQKTLQAQLFAFSLWCYGNFFKGAFVLEVFLKYSLWKSAVVFQYIYLLKVDLSPGCFRGLANSTFVLVFLHTLLKVYFVIYSDNWINCWAGLCN